MMDGSLLPDQKTPAAYDYNVDVSRRVVKRRTRSAFPLKANWVA